MDDHHSRILPLVDATESPSKRAEPELRAIAFWEIASLGCTLLICAWALPALADNSRLLAIPVAAVFLFILISHRIHGESARDLGWRLDNFARSCVMLAFPMLAVVAALIVAGWVMGSLRPKAPAEWREIIVLPLLGVAWGVVQQYVLQGFVNRRAQMVLGKGVVSCLVVAAVFAIFHLPNIWLSVATFAGGLLWAAVYQRYPNLWAVGLSHAIMTFILVRTIPESALHGLRVGFRLLGP